MARLILAVLTLLLGAFPGLPLGQHCFQGIGDNLPRDPGTTYSEFTVPANSVQALLPAYRFNCSGILTRLRARVSGEDGSDQIIFQVWRPKRGGEYTIVADLIYPGSKASREGSMLTLTPLMLGIPVKRGDVMGFYVENSSEQDTEDKLRLLFDSRMDTTVYYVLGTGMPRCNFSLCADSTVQAMQNTAPLISIDFDTESSEQEIETLENIISSSGVHENCQVRTFSSCANEPNVVQPQMPSPSPSPNDRLQDETEPPFPLDEKTSNDVGNSRGDAGGSDDEKFTPATIAFVAVGALLFIILIVLVVVLIVCICRKRGSSLHLSTKAEVESIGGPSASTRLGASVEHRQQGNTTANGNNSVSVSPHVESPTTPSNDYYNMAALVEDSRGNVRENQRQLTRSASSATESISVRVQSPVRRYTMSGCCGSDSRRIHHYSVLEPPVGMLQSPLPSPSHATPPGKMGQNGMANGSTPYYALPSEEHCSTTYDHLDLEDGVSGSPRDTTPVRHRYDRLSPATRTKEAPGHYHLDLSKQQLLTFSQESASSSERSVEQRRNSSLKYCYVPTEEQRRLLQLHNLAIGRYEIDDDEQPVQGYDKLKFFQEKEVYWAPASTTADLYTQLYENKYREIPREQVNILKPIGSGHFGKVSKGLWSSEEGPRDVAVKIVKSNKEEERVKLLQEAAIMGQFAHKNVVKLHGVITVGEPVLVLLEYMQRGDLKSFLQKMHPRNSKRELPQSLPRVFIKFSKDVAAGMSYLSRKSFVHRDLAARNILITHDLTCKIGDFGMARDIAAESDYYTSHGGIIPVKWTAPEALNYNKYTSASDVWSFGMVLFEIWSVGEKPFSDLTNPIVIALVNSKHCQAPPPGCPRPIYHLMVECWNPKHSQRPTFDSIYNYMDSPEESLLQWAQEDLIPGKQAHVVGAPLLEAIDLYFDLQRTYQKPMKRALKK